MVVKKGQVNTLCTVLTDENYTFSRKFGIWKQVFHLLNQSFEGAPFVGTKSSALPIIQMAASFNVEILERYS